MTAPMPPVDPREPLFASPPPPAPGQTPAPAVYRTPPLGPQVQAEVRKGWRVAYQDEWTAVLEKGGNTSHLFHLVLTLVTVGFWSPVWLVLSILNRKRSQTITA